MNAASNFPRRHMILSLRILGVALLSMAIAEPSSTAEITITDFGATSADNTDDIAAIHAAIASAAPGDTVLIPAGTWNISDSISVDKSLVLLGAGNDLTSIVFSGQQERPLIDLGGDGPVTIAKLTLDGNNHTQCTQGVEAASIRGVWINHVRVKNLVSAGPDAFGPHGIYFAAEVLDSKITNCELINIGVDSIWGAGIRLSNQSARVEVTGNTIRDTGRGGILLNNGVVDSIIRNNQITNIGLYSNGDDEGPGLGIELFSECDRSIVEDNVLDHWLSLDNSDYVAVRRNTIGGDDLTSLKFASLEAAGQCEFCVFADNQTGKGNQIGISVSNDDEKRHILWLRNRITNAGTWGAQIQGGEDGAFRMYFRQNQFSNSLNTTTSLFNAGGHGFRINENVRQMVFDQNIFSDNQEVGMQIFDGSDSVIGVDELTFIGNTFSGNQSDSIELDPEATLQDIDWTNNTVTGNNPNFSLTPTGFTNNPVPNVTITAPASVGTGQPVPFSFTYQGAGTVTTSLWDFGSQIPSSLANPNLTFDTPGQYRVSLVVWNNLGRAAFAETVLEVVALPSVQYEIFEDGDESYLTLAYPRPTNGEVVINTNAYQTAEFIYLVQDSIDLVQWNNGPNAIIPSAHLPALPSGFEWGQYCFPTPVSATDKAYMRLLIDLIPSGA